MSNTLLIFLGAGLGGIGRYWISNGFYWVLGRQFPYGTLFVNASGCFLMGLLFILITNKFSHFEHPLRSLLLIGFLGGYTTFSSFSLETIILFERGVWLGAVLNILVSVLLCIVMTSLGITAGKQLGAMF